MYFHGIIIKQMDIISKMQNILFAENYYMQPYSFYMAAICNETATRKVWFWTLASFQFFLQLK